jgi:hypothetical protein
VRAVPDLALCRKLRTRARRQAVAFGVLVVILVALLIAGHKRFDTSEEALGTTVALTGLVWMCQMMGQSRRTTRVMTESQNQVGPHHQGRRRGE